MAKKKNTSQIDTLTKEIRTRAKTVQKRANGELKKIEKELKTLERKAKRSDTYKGARKLRRDLDKQLTELHTQVLGAFGLASRTDLDKLNKKLNTINRKVNEIARAA